MLKFLHKALDDDPDRDWAQLVVDVTEQLMGHRTEWRWIDIAMCLDGKPSQPHPICCNDAVGVDTASNLVTHMSSEARRIVDEVLANLTTT